MRPSGPITVFGGTGFLGQRVVHHLLDHGYQVRVVSRHPDRSAKLFSNDGPRLASVGADIEDKDSTANALTGSWGVVNAVSLYTERGAHTFYSVHVEAAGRLARLARQKGLHWLLHVSGIGSTPESSSPYIRSRGRGEIEVRKAFPEATIIRPAVMFGRNDKFLVPLMDLIRRMPILPLFGSGLTRLQPAHVEDVGQAIARIVDMPRPAKTYEFGGPQVLTYRNLLERIRAQVGSNTVLMPMPFSLWHAAATVSEYFPRPPIARNQVDLMRKDNVAWHGPG